jgi:glycyl-tRNA synthetase
MIDYQTLTDDTVTIRHRDSMQQDRVAVAQIATFLAERI